MASVFQSPIIQGSQTPVQQPSAGELLQTIMMMKEHKQREDAQKKAQAAESFKMGSELATKEGMFIPELFEPLFKEFKIDPTKVSKTADLMTPKGGAQAANPPSEDAGRKAPGGGVDAGGIASKGGKQSIMDIFQQRASQRAQEIGANAEQQKMMQGMISKTVKDMNEAMGKGDAQGVGKSASMLMTLGALPYQETPYIVGQMSGPMHENWINMKAGMETPDKFAARRDTLIQHLTSTYKGTLTPTEAGQAAEALAKGQPVPPEIDKKITTFDSINRQVEAYIKFSTTLPAPYAQAAAKIAASGGNPMDAIPDGTQTFQEMEMMDQHKRTQIAGQQLDIERERLNLEKTKYDQENARIKASASLLETEEMTKQMTALATLKKSGVKGDMYDGLERQLLNNIARQSGMKLQDVTHWWNFTRQYALAPDSGEDELKKFAGNKQPGQDSKGLTQDIKDIFGEFADRMGDKFVKESTQDEINKRKKSKPAASSQEPI